MFSFQRERDSGAGNGRFGTVCVRMTGSLALTRASDTPVGITSFEQFSFVDPDSLLLFAETDFSRGTDHRVRANQLPALLRDECAGCDDSAFVAGPLELSLTENMCR